jgi:hypothetical protein
MVSRARCFLTVIEIAIHSIAVSPHSADTARPLSRQEMPTLPAAPLTQRLASGPPKPQNHPPKNRDRLLSRFQFDNQLS